MSDFALVAEGPTDQVVLKNILRGYFKGQRDPVIHYEHPDPRAVSRYGGWTVLFQYLRGRKYRQAFQLHRYVVIQVDTDVCEERGFDVPRQDLSGPLSCETLVANVIERLQQEIEAEDLVTYAGRFIFAVAVHEIECWVLPLWFEGSHSAKVSACVSTLGGSQNLRNALDGKNWRWISAEEKSVNSYDLASREYRKPIVLKREGRKNPSLAVFLDRLDGMNLVLPAQE